MRRVQSVNGDQVADIAVASHQGGQYQVTIYSGWGQDAASLSTGFAPMVLATIANPFRRTAGPLDVALGDFNGDGISDLAISASGSNRVSTWTFRTNLTSPLNATVTPIPLATPFTPPGLKSAAGIDVAAIDFDGEGGYELIAAPSSGSTNKLVVLSYGSQAGWQATRSIKGIPVQAGKGLSVAAGDVTGDGTADIVVGSKSNGELAVQDGALDRWVWALAPLGKKIQSLRVAVVSSEGAPGSIVVTGNDHGASQAAIISWNGAGVRDFQPIRSPGGGSLVPVGGGYMYQRSTIVYPTNPLQFPYSPGPATPTVLLASTKGSGIIIQGFTAVATKNSSTGGFQPSVPDTYVEPLWGPYGNGFIPLQPHSDPATSGVTTTASNLDDVPMNLVVLPNNTYNSPYSIDLSGVPSDVFNGLENITSLQSSTTDPWGPSPVPNLPPQVTSQTTTRSLQARVLAAYESFLGVDYQHHYNPTWTPTQQNLWNMTSTVAYQSQGVDCTNFTAFAYGDALGILLPGATPVQGAITSNSDITIPPEISNWISLQTFGPSDWKNNYTNLVNMLQPGDILYIKGENGKISHAITWIGPELGKDQNKKDTYLVIDSTGITPQHVDSNNRIIPEGVRIRPFGDSGSVNNWYFNNLDHVLRIIKDT